MVSVHPRTVQAIYLLHVMVFEGGQPRTGAASDVSDRARSQKLDKLGDDLRGRLAGALRNVLIERRVVLRLGVTDRYVFHKSTGNGTVHSLRCLVCSKRDSTHGRTRVSRFG